MKAGLLPREQDHGRNGTGACDQGNRQGEDRRVGAILAGLVLATLGAALEQHVEGGQEQKDAACDAEGGHRDADKTQNGLTRCREQQQQERGHQHGAQADGAALAGAQALCQGHEKRHQADRIDDHEQGDEGADQKGRIHPAP
jgi:hypothetical protein